MTTGNYDYWKSIWEWPGIKETVSARCDSRAVTAWNAKVIGFRLRVIHDFARNGDDVPVGNCGWCGQSASSGNTATGQLEQERQ
jgi:hypothetical protein